MAFGESLLERLRRAGDSSAPTGGSDEAVLTASVAANIRRILASRQGHAPAQMDYGVPSPAEVVNISRDGLEAMQSLLKVAIERYEPRLRDVNVLQLLVGEEKDQVVFSVRGRLALAAHPSVSFDIYITPQGRLELVG